MKFLCLHGTFGSAKKFKIQLAPFVQKTQEDSDLEFEWISGLHEVDPPAEFEHYFGEKPLYRFMPFNGIRAYDDLFTKWRQCPDGASTEENMRLLFGSEENFLHQKACLQETIDAVLKAIDDDPEIDGILGYSEGATIAATAILEERRRWEEEGIPRRINCAIFFAGCPAISLKDGSISMLSDAEAEDAIDIPTCHVVGCNDPYIDGSITLYDMCNEDKAELFDHGQGHVIPRDPRTLEELSVSVSRIVGMANANKRKPSVTGSESDASRRSSTWSSGNSSTVELTAIYT
ncbi:hypothetical protein VD0004_g7881 [Verticillium dahliae]|uniref:Serine hydrolase domain-containing protein n=1 Tax=Verticillium dahliae TaxID=27337 RepID=A0A366P5W1_VERDA|nr:hypothetical protein VdG1_08801 [Verticillium dahliae VDG1]PNH38980.1 hypothetical protein VD0004_g7881 [Verticillium dahliae]PNH67553.1 hypothetical protein VD0001_g7793 [Verticillium dahliae]RBQ87992.1 hypothetical protein VDGD_03467 [Verticillium dahliae]RXG42380.1 hypothetical protein VDGE_03467 [Verticillium dahliae]